MSKKSKQTNFQDGWLLSEEFKAWLCKASTKGEARCRLCQTNIALSNMGIRALRSHAGNKSHAKKVKKQAEIKNFFAKRNGIRPANLSSEEKQLQFSLDTEGLVEIQPSCSANSQSTIPLVFQDGGKLNAEIQWVLKHVVSGYSDNSVTGSVNLFQSKFPDSKIASIMELGKDKLKYVVNYGIAPYFTQLLKEQVSSSEWFVVSYDESLNQMIQESEMNFVIRFWDSCLNRVQVRYWNSMFLGHATAIDLLKAINDGLLGFDLSTQIQLSMDGPSVNLKVLNEIGKEREDAGLSKLINVGSCNLHVVHGALKSATFCCWLILYCSFIF